ncbi:small subunit of phenylpropionate dioxygenase [Mycobacteroides abscessus subsp. bolletii]|uniref:aromatic-ring-hydroxylating dioxygenase subunit beta n=1 Tax=Mycobacteroides TaxID=670516 RepID=UPI0009A87560|nr:MULTISPECIES: aromatic-ring-hydroxylating dioxygenase subunit beta [Mycobacteroides]WJR32171.1 aromatic-ring-hydroxylating dioxygenase subunit beta [Mycobacteroides immunogenum]SKY48237.1 small subunit of phenylpropionate dioxygenase [Mycobacteroides abscessus subsp. bolletii]
MSVDALTSVTNTGLDSVVRQHRIEQFLYHEAQLLDHWQWDSWLELFADDILYWMPVRKNRLRRQRDKDEVPDGIEMAHFYDDHASLRLRVNQMHSGTHWAEDPPSRCRHLVTNVRVAERDSSLASPEYDVMSNFLVYRNRLESETDIWAGERRDVLRVNGAGFLIAKRTILLDQNVVQSKNLSVLF